MEKPLPSTTRFLFERMPSPIAKVAVAFFARLMPMPGTILFRISLRGPRNGMAKTLPSVMASSPSPRNDAATPPLPVKTQEPSSFPFESSKPK